jgi:hypothetical protein
MREGSTAHKEQNCAPSVLVNSMVAPVTAASLATPAQQLPCASMQPRV